MTNDELMQKLREAKPSWQTDGKGVKGDPVIYHRETTNMNFKPSEIGAAQTHIVPLQEAKLLSNRVPLGAPLSDAAESG